ncbi:MAG TPA: lytic murein transglycosylase [Candidatus Paceibacterota bacterium]|nr:lytic murein transglycosylase [Candidatus Paceibacterota bacterium]
MGRKIYDVNSGGKRRLNLSYTPVTRIPISRVFNFAIIILVLLAFSGLLVGTKINAPTVAAEATSTENGVTSQEERAALENQLNELERQIAEDQKKIEEYRKQGNTLKGEINSLNARINQLNLQIKAINLNLDKLNDEITSTQKKINVTENKISGHKLTLSKNIRDLYESDSQSLMEVLLANRNISDFFGNIESITLVQSNIKTALDQIVALREDLLEQKQELALEKSDVENLKNYRESQKKMIASTQAEKKRLLTITKGKESEYQKIVAENKESAAQIRSRIFQLLGGGELSFEKAYEYAKLAEGATGVRAAFILAILQHESLLGKNVGRCSYTTAMHPTRDIPVFLALLSKLGIDSNSTVAYVSCPNAHGAYGGAMGPAQFIPSTWALYGGWKKNGTAWEYFPDKDSIGSVSGNQPSNPWNNADAFVATAIYLKDSLESSACRNYASQIPNQAQTLKERCAAAKYYAGNRWYNYRFVYGDPVLKNAAKFQQDIEILTAG